MSIADAVAAPPVSTLVGANIGLRTTHLRYLRMKADHDGISLSRALAGIIAAQAPDASRTLCRIEKVWVHLNLQPDHMEALDALAVRMGLTRSDVVRRLIDQARGA